MLWIFIMSVLGGVLWGTVLGFPLKSYQMLSMVCLPLVVGLLAWQMGYSRGRGYEG